MPYLELLGDYWGELCTSQEVASRWADELMPTVETVWADNAAGRHGFFKGTSACMSALYAAKRYDELLALLEKSRHKWWHCRQCVKQRAKLSRFGVETASNSFHLSM